MSDDVKVTDDMPEGVTVMCMRVADSSVVFADSVRCPCAGCGEEIHHRPYVPAHARKLCVQCVAEEATKLGKENVTFATQRRALEEARLYLSKTGRKQ